jgi:predicted membrane protein
MPITSGVALVIVGVVLWLLNAYVPLGAGIKKMANVVLGLIVVGILLWLINTYIPMAGSIKAILNIVVVIATCVGVLQAVGLWGDVVRMWNNMWNNFKNRRADPEANSQRSAAADETRQPDLSEQPGASEQPGTIDKPGTRLVTP